MKKSQVREQQKGEKNRMHWAKWRENKRNNEVELPLLEDPEVKEG